MKDIGKDFYCSAGYEFTDMEDGNICPMQLHLEEEDRDCKNCGCCKHKHPTLSQFKEDYGFDVPDGMPIYTSAFNTSGWSYNVWYADKKPHLAGLTVIVACTPFPMPERDWEPQ